jgi:hypothetical protein
MEQFHVISLLGAGARFCNDNTDLAQATRELNRMIVQRHLRHAAAWLLRAAIVAGLFLLGQFGIEGTIGGALSWTAGFLSIYVLWYLSKGHLLIQGDRQAKLYWLENDAGNTEFSSNDPIIATMPAQEPMQANQWFGKTAS